ncbi:MAG: NAD(P)/FAD-dependent oxidoreductase [Candidatus Omnitrophica bacterium]|nr:NAD(P)/FAD-dependent oxidoreductase [Candidatus Omnitrophota bacterium]
MADFSVLIIGAGVIGLAIGKKLAEDGMSVGILEKRKRYGLETSSRNSEVLHSGIHYSPGSLKAILSVTGNRLWKETLKLHGLTYVPSGKITVASNRQEVEAIEKLYRQGRENGVPGLEMLTRKQVKNLEPDIEGKIGLFTPSTALINAHQAMDFLAQAFKEAGGLLALASPVTGLEKVGQEYRVTVRKDKEDSYLAEKVINCAGLLADQVAGFLGMKYQLSWAKGDYFSLHQNLKVTRLVYPVPTPYSLGIHLTPRIGGSYRLGPDVEYVEKKEPAYPDEDRQGSYLVNPEKRDFFYQEARKYLPSLERSKIVPETYGLRPRLQPAGSESLDFMIKDEADQGFPGFINLLGIESPGLTAALAIASYVREIL